MTEENILPMEEEILDFSGVTPFEPLDSKAMYLCEVSNLEFQTSSTNKRMVVAELEIVAPETCNKENWEANDEGDMVFVSRSTERIACKGRKLFRNFVMEQKALPFLYNFLKACNPEVELNEAFRLRPAEWIGSRLAIKGDNQAYEEQVRLQPNKVYAASKYVG